MKRSRAGHVLHFVADTGPLIHSRTPSVVTVHGVASKWVEGVRTRRAEAVWRHRVKAAIASTAKVITVSESSADDIAEVFGIARASIAVIPHGIESDKFAQACSLSPEVRAVVPENYLLYVGNIEPRKNLIELVAAAGSEGVRKLGLPLVIAGKAAWDADEAMSKIVASKNVIYVGFVSEDDKIALMQNCAAFVFPSKYEGFGFPVLEAMAAGAAVITTDRGALREVAGPAKIIPGLDADSITETIVDAVSDGSWMRDAAGRGRRWASTFAWEKSIDSHIGVYSSVVHA
ncbi:glycosyltransferase family 4 protein [Rhodococcus sp. NPDC003318]|uniref:glycosyltransferase family 4 protein n=1 Tax=Rhodococcus sp. NPDC003318 TaxID=3364503 RepID=UPI003679BF4E